MAGGAHRDEAAPLQAASAGPPPPILFVAPAQAGAAGGIAPSSLHRPIAVPVCAGDDDQGITPALPPPRRSAGISPRSGSPRQPARRRRPTPRAVPPPCTPLPSHHDGGADPPQSGKAH